MDETKLTKQDKEELKESAKELLIDLLNEMRREFLAKLNELEDRINTS